MPGAVTGQQYERQQAGEGRLVNPLVDAHVTAERIDQGVDYAGTGSLVAIARGVITDVAGAGSGWPGNAVVYKITDQSSPLFGQSIYYAEGVTPTVKVGDTVNPGQKIANLIPGWHSGIEIGYASGISDSTYASTHGGYSEGELTPAGQAFSDLIAGLGGPAGLTENRSVGAGSAPPGDEQLATALKGNSVGSALAQDLLPFGAIAGGAAVDAVGAGALAKAAKNALTAGKDASNLAEGATGLAAIGAFLNDPTRAILTIVFVVGGALMMFSGAGKMLGFESPLKSTASKLPGLPG